MCGEASEIGTYKNILNNRSSLQRGYVTEQDCSKWPREVCTVNKELKTKFNPVTKCEKVYISTLKYKYNITTPGQVPQELCGPSGCGYVPGPVECHDTIKTVVTDIPSEECDLQPQRSCKTIVIPPHVHCTLVQAPM